MTITVVPRATTSTASADSAYTTNTASSTSTTNICYPIVLVLHGQAYIYTGNPMYLCTPQGTTTAVLYLFVAGLVPTGIGAFKAEAQGHLGASHVLTPPPKSTRCRNIVVVNIKH